MKSKFENLRVIGLKAQNVKRISAVEIEPDGSLVVVSGKNSQGKSSLVDSIWLALTGKQAGKTVETIIRDGEEVAHIELQLGNEQTELVVKKTWGATKVPKLQVMDTNGMEYKKAQTLLDSLIASSSFDPMEFMNMPEKGQVDLLMAVCGKAEELRELDETRAALYESRTELNRNLSQTNASLATMPNYGDEFAELVDPVSLMNQIREAEGNVEAMRTIEKNIETKRERGVQLKHQIEELQRELDGVTKYLEEADVELGEVSKKCHAVDLEELNAKLQNIEVVNDKVRANQNRTKLEEERARLEGLTSQATADIEELDEDKRQMILESDMPVPGLGFSEEGVTFQGVSLKDCSSSEQLRISVAIGCAMNKAINIIRIKDGALLDSDALTLIAEMAEKNNCQVWVEMVDETGDMGIVIEDGMVKE